MFATHERIASAGVSPSRRNDVRAPDRASPGDSAPTDAGTGRLAVRAPRVDVIACRKKFAPPSFGLCQQITQLGTSGRNERVDLKAREKEYEDQREVSKEFYSIDRFLLLACKANGSLLDHLARFPGAGLRRRRNRGSRIPTFIRTLRCGTRNFGTKLIPEFPAIGFELCNPIADSFNLRSDLVACEPRDRLRPPNRVEIRFRCRWSSPKASWSGISGGSGSD